ncbi:MAG: hypothetical protein JOY96_07485 [Verrucomicrobia bacterium]|nr:hypothetical protein [Verrucomicrobiota bacterium]MBV9674003.1 hypothetical protein [Verrucomicrobiota bacterium]
MKLTLFLTSMDIRLLVLILIATGPDPVFTKTEFIFDQSNIVASVPSVPGDVPILDDSSRCEKAISVAENQEADPENAVGSRDDFSEPVIGSNDTEAVSEGPANQSQSSQPNTLQADPNETADRQLRAAATEYILSGSSPSLDREMALYADRVDYYDDGIKDYDEIRADLARLRKKWPIRHYAVSKITRTRYDAQKDVGAIIVHYTFEVSNGSEHKTGEKDTFIVFDRVLEQPRVILVKEEKAQ